MKRKLLSLLIVVSLVLLCFTQTAFAVEIPTADTDLSENIVIIHTNDSHGHVDDNMGFSAVSALIAQYEDAGAGVLVLDAGDTFHGMPLATLNEGADIVPIINEIGYSAMAAGNHDFNYGFDRLMELEGGLGFPVLAANIVTDDGAPAFLDNIIVDVTGVRFGIFGLSTPETAYQTDPKYVEGLQFLDPVDVATQQVAFLREKNVDYIIGLMHMGVDPASEITSDRIAAQVDGIDIIIDGHSHTQMADGEPLDTSITLVPHGDTIIASTGCYIETIGVVTISPDGAITAGLVTVDDYDRADPAIDEAVETIRAEQGPELQEVVGHTPYDLNGERGDIRTSETNLGDLVCDAFLYETGADLALVNSGSIRASIAAGDITREDLITVFPFGNYIVTKEITGDAILAALEHGVSGYPDELGAFPQVSGIEFAFDPGQQAGSRVTEATINGEEIQPTQSYMIAINDFLKDGGDDYTMFMDFPVVQTYNALDQVLTEYIAGDPDIPEAPLGRIQALAQDDQDAVDSEENSAPEENEEAAAADEPLPLPPDNCGEEHADAQPKAPEAAEPEDTDTDANASQSDTDTADANSADESAEAAGEEAPVVEAIETPSNDNEPPAASGATYTVQRGDSLWRIAQSELDDGHLWTEIYDMNRDTVFHPDELEIGQELQLPGAMPPTGYPLPEEEVMDTCAPPMEALEEPVNDTAVDADTEKNDSDSAEGEEDPAVAVSESDDNTTSGETPDADDDDAVDTQETTDAGQTSYTVKKGDCLWHIAVDQLGDGLRWVEIYEMNRSDIYDPDLIEIGQVLKIPAA